MIDYEPGSMMLSDEERRLLGLWAADCAERALPLFEAKASSDTRPREAISGKIYRTNTMVTDISAKPM
jgi:hypothetical protein